MSENKEELKQLITKQQKEELIDKEYKKLMKIYKNVPDQKKNLVQNLCKQLSFCMVTLQEVKDDILEKGTIVEFTQGSQHYLKENPSVGVFNRLCKTYQSLLKQLNDFSEVKVEAKDDPLIEFAKSLK